jgi:hypothetical protein
LRSLREAVGHGVRCAPAATRRVTQAQWGWCCEGATQNAVGPSPTHKATCVTYPRRSKLVGDPPGRTKATTSPREMDTAATNCTVRAAGAAKSMGSKVTADSVKTPLALPDSTLCVMLPQPSDMHARNAADKLSIVQRSRYMPHSLRIVVNSNQDEWCSSDGAVQPTILRCGGPHGNLSCLLRLRCISARICSSAPAC